MAITPDALRSHIDYTTWASLRLLDAAATLSHDELTRDFATSEHSVLGTLVHIFAADRLWLARLTHSPLPDFVTPADHNLAALQSAWPAVLQGWKEFAAALTPETVQADLFYHDLKGNPWTQPLWQLILHVVNHGTHHRGQVSGFLRALNRVPPPIDLTVFYRQIAANAAKIG